MGSVIFKALHKLSKNNQVVFACTIWSIWKQRNDLIWRNESMLRVAVCARGTNLLNSWQNAQVCRNRTIVQQQLNENHTWKKSDVGRFKCNVDVAFSTATNRVGIGICIRDEQGSFVLAKIE